MSQTGCWHLVAEREDLYTTSFQWPKKEVKVSIQGGAQGAGRVWVQRSHGLVREVGVYLTKVKKVG